MCLGKVSAISLDLDDTLWPFGQAVERAEASLHAWLLEHAPKTAAVLSSPNTLRVLRNQFESSRPDLANQYRAIRVGSIQLALELSGDDLNLTDAAYSVFFAARQRVEFFDDVWPALEWLSARFPLVAVSNGNAELQMTGCDHFFQATLNAAGFGAAKPDAAIFHAAASAVGVSPVEMLHVGDDPELDIAGALNAGLQAAWIVRPNGNWVPQWGRGIPAPNLIISDLLMLCGSLARNG